MKLLVLNFCFGFLLYNKAILHGYILQMVKVTFKFKSNKFLSHKLPLKHMLHGLIIPSLPLGSYNTLLHLPFTFLT